MTITLLDTEYAKLIANGGRLPDEVIISGDTYVMDYIEPEVGLLNMDVYTMYATAQEQA